jgi:hypothetical protein
MTTRKLYYTQSNRHSTGRLLNTHQEHKALNDAAVQCFAPCSCAFGATLSGKLLETVYHSLYGEGMNALLAAF